MERCTEFRAVQLLHVGEHLSDRDGCEMFALRARHAERLSSVDRMVPGFGRMASTARCAWGGAPRFPQGSEA